MKFALAHAHARAAGAHDEARRLVAHVEPEDWQAILYVTLGEEERAVTMVEADLQRHGVQALRDLRCFPEWEVLRAHPAVRSTLEELGLPS